MNELIQMIQSDPELWELVERLKNQDEDLEDFLLGLAQMFAVEYRELERSDLNDKLESFFGGLPQKALSMAPSLLHIALDIYIMQKLPNKNDME
mgnify:FL=1|tara:strand:- start:423 stop:704 length:282 start_codon:yes stop_codon:yes gene_type:complete